MKKPQSDPGTLRALTARAGRGRPHLVTDADGRVDLADLAAGSTLAAPLAQFAGRSVLIATQRQLPAVLTMLQLDGVARRMLLVPPDLPPAHLPALLAGAAVDVIVSDGTWPLAPATLPVVACSASVRARAATDAVPPGMATEWLLLTSGTTGQPKLVLHTLASLSAPLADGLVTPDAVWSTFYDARRYGGLQILLRALLGGGTMVLSQAGEPVAQFLTRAAAAGVTHMSGTPSHWRRALMSVEARALAPRYVRLSGEVADQAILDQLAAAFPRAGVAHAFASTEAGVAFDVRDGVAGFPAALIGQPGQHAELRVVDGTLRIRSGGTAARYLGDAKSLADEAGFVDTNDLVELRGDRYHFVGRREGVINVGGQKVHPEEVEAVISRHRLVQMARVRGRPSPILGTLVVADIVMQPGADATFDCLSEEILAACRQALPPHKVPAMLQRADALEIAGSGKLVRHGA